MNKLLRSGIMLTLLLIGTQAPCFGESTNVRSEFIALTIRGFQTVSREAVLSGDDTSLINYVTTLGRAPIVEYAMFVSSSGIIQAHTDGKQIGRKVTDAIGINALANRDPNALRLADFKNPQNETVFDASLPVTIGVPRDFRGLVRIGFKRLK